jgi:hypothetical protein
VICLLEAAMQGFFLCESALRDGRRYASFF